MSFAQEAPSSAVSGFPELSPRTHWCCFAASQPLLPTGLDAVLLSLRQPCSSLGWASTSRAPGCRRQLPCAPLGTVLLG